MEDNFIVTYDSNYPDVPTLVVARKNNDDITIVNEFQGDLAFGVYCLLTDMAMLQERHAKWEWFDAWEGDDTFGKCMQLRCSACLETEGARENAKFCPNCGAIMDLE